MAILGNIKMEPVYWLVLSAALLVPWPMWAQSPADSRPLPWTRVSYSASKFFLTATVDVSLGRVSAAQVTAVLAAAGTHSGLMPVAESVVLTTIDSRLVRQATQLQLWHGTDLRMLQRTALYTGRKNWFRLTRYTTDGVFSLKRRPRPGESGNELAKWSDTAEDFYPYGFDSKAYAATEPEVVFYALTQGGMQHEGDHLALYTNDHGQPLRLDIRAESAHGMPVDFERIEPSGTSQVDAKVNVLHLVMRATPLTVGAKTDEMKFLGLTGDIQLLFDPVTRLVFELKGSADVVGEVRFQLRRVTVDGSQTNLK